MNYWRRSSGSKAIITRVQRLYYSTVIHQNKVRVFYDGGCSLCTKEITHYQNLIKDKPKLNGKILWHDIHKGDLGEIGERGVSFQQAMDRMHVIDEANTMKHGVEAFVALWRQLPFYWVLSSAVNTIPGSVRVLEWVYGFWTRHRQKASARRGECDSDKCSVKM